MDLEERDRVQATKDALSVRQNRGGDITSDESEWKQDPPSAAYDKSLAYFAEIVNASGFDASSLLVDYEILVPEGWNMRTGNLSDGVAERDMLDVVQIAKESDNAELKAAGDKMQTKMDLDGYEDGDNGQGTLRGITHTAKVGGTRGGLVLPQLRPLWRGKHVPFVIDEVSRLIWAGLFFFTACVSVILGIEYPTWIVPGLVFVFTLGTGYPGGPVQALVGPRDDRSSHRLFR